MSSVPFGFVTGVGCECGCRDEDGDALVQSASVGADARIDALVGGEGVRATGGGGVHDTCASVATKESRAVGVSETAVTSIGHAVRRPEVVSYKQRSGLKPRR